MLFRLRLSFWSLLQFCLISGIASILAALLWLLNSEPAAEWLLQKLDAKLPALTLTDVSGSIAQGLRVKTVYYELPNWSINIANLAVEPHLLSALHGQVKFKILSAEQIKIKQIAATAATSVNKDFAWDWAWLFNLIKPLNLIQLETVAVQLLRLELLDKQPLELANIALAAKLTQQQLSIESLQLEDVNGSAQLTGTMSAAAPYPVKLEVHWQTAATPAVTALTKLKSLQLSLQGNPQDYALQGQLDLHWPEYGLDSPLILEQANGNLEQFTLQQAYIDLADGRLKFSGRLQWEMQTEAKPLLQAELSAELQNINPGYWRPEWFGAINGQVHWLGNDLLQQPQHQLQISNMQGMVRNEPWQIQGELSGSRIEDITGKLEAHWGDNQLQIQRDGQTGKDPFSWSFQLPELAVILPQISGNIAGKGKIYDFSLDKLPQLITADLTAKQLSYQEWFLDELQLALTANNGKQELNIKLAELAKRNAQNKLIPVISQWQLQASGQKLNYNYTTELQSPNGNSSMRGQVQLLRTKPWVQKLRIRDWQLDSAWTDKWQLAAGVAWTTTEPLTLCLQRVAAAGSLCLQLTEVLSKNRTINLTVQQLPLTITEPWWPPGLELAGELNGQLFWNAVQGLSGTIGSTEGQIIHNVIGNVVERYSYQDLFTTIKYQPEIGLQLQSGIVFPGNGQIRAELTQAENTPIKFQLTGQLEQISLFEAFLPELFAISGHANFDLHGELDAKNPSLQGQFSWLDGSLTIPALGVHWEQLNCELRAIPATKWPTVEINGKLISAPSKPQVQLDRRLGFNPNIPQVKGKLNLNGNWQWLQSAESEDTWLLKLTLAADQLLLMNLPEQYILANGVINIDLQPKQLNLSGQLKIPAGYIGLPRIADGGVDVSPDEKIISTEIITTEQLRINTDLSLSLGDELYFHGGGITAKLIGDLNIRQRPEQPIQAFGDLILLNGRYQLLGQTLSIAQGQLLFQGSAIDPGLNIRIERRVEETLVGLRINGTLNNPTSEPFSVPTLPDSDILAILATGRPLANTTTDEREALIQLATAISLSQGQNLIDQIADTIGLDVITLDTNGDYSGDLSQSTLLFGKYLSPKLFVRYVFGILDKSTAIGLEYSIKSNLKLDAQSGDQQSIDIIYQFKR